MLVGCVMDFHWRIVNDLDYSIRTEKPAINKDQPDRSPLEIFSQNPSAQETFNCAMTGLSLAEGAAIVQAYDFSQFGRIVDAGGGHDVLATMISRAVPRASVTVFDFLYVIEGTKKRLEDENLTDKIATGWGRLLRARSRAVQPLCIEAPHSRLG